tara:strand:+ start:448 stop:780 length:333 start_codon:yes stop_codon:yes gene_type:complete
MADQKPNATKPSTPPPVNSTKSPGAPPVDDYDFFYHGLFMWCAWTFLALLQISSNRYLKATFFGFHMWVHRIVGTLILVITWYHGSRAFKKVGKNVIQNSHSVFVFPILS